MKLLEDLDVAASFSEPGDGITRPAWSPVHMEALDWFRGRLAEAGLDSNLDAAGNVIGRWQAGDGPALGLGSHLDSVPNGGRFDGTLGTLSSLAVVELLRERGFTPSRPIWVMAFMDEEGTRFGASMFGSRAFAGDDLAEYLEYSDAEGVTVAEAMSRAGHAPRDVASARAIDNLGQFIELHVEQGRVLDDAGIEIGIVSGIVGLLQAQIEIRGEEDHAGATPMRARRDALAGAARIMLALREHARSLRDVTLTVGKVSVRPGAYNVIPGYCSFSVDFRAADPDQFATLGAIVEGTVATIVAEEGLVAEIHLTDQIAPAPLDEGLLSALEHAAEDEGASHMRLPSGAGHDTQVLAPFVPSAMLFVPSKGGISHSPAEQTRPEHCELGARVLARAVELLNVSSSAAGNR
jgi:hydantoinase/carbamoylase family amidase